MQAYVSDTKSWGYKPVTRQQAIELSWLPDSIDAESLSGTVLPFGNGRSYGDSCLNSAGAVINTSRTNRIIQFDRETGVITGESGLLLKDILDLIIPAGWFFPVCPGTSFVTLAGAIANDVHGKNHHVDGTIGRHVTRLCLLRSDGRKYECSPTNNVELFNATIGGLGLTGLITEISIQLMPIASSYMDVRYDTFNGLHEFVALSERRKKFYQYTVAWLDCANPGDAFARGVFIAANHTSSSNNIHVRSNDKVALNIPLNLPAKCLNKHSIRAFNSLYFKRHKLLDKKTLETPYRQFFFPLDSVNNWNRIYGVKGFHQYQFVVPLERLDVLESVLSIIVESGLGSFLAVLKEFGPLSSPGLLSFPRQGWCLALDFADRGEETVELINTINSHIMNAGGAVYPAKDRIMTRETFNLSFPGLPQFLEYKDVAFSSDLWRRVNGES